MTPSTEAVAVLSVSSVPAAFHGQCHNLHRCCFCSALGAESGCYGQREAEERGLWLLLGEDQDAGGEDVAPWPTGKELHIEPGWQLMHHAAILSCDLCALKTVTCKI